jgi:asparagine synthetase B (glutamine-hydrolysing)
MASTRFTRTGGAPQVDRDELVATREFLRWPRRRRRMDVAGRAGTGHRRLPSSTIPAGCSRCTGALSIIFNGEIYNYRELRARPKRAKRLHLN